MNLTEYGKIINKFHAERNWIINNPNFLITSVLIELGELSEHYQWKKDFSEIAPEKKQEIAFEFADVLIYLISLAEKTGIDLDTAIIEKLEKLRVKYPAGISDEDYYKAKEAYRESGKNKLYN